MIRAVADTHAILWYLYNDARLSNTASGVMDSAGQNSEQIAISSITLAEIIYLIEKGKIATVAFERMIGVLEQANSRLVEIPFNYAIADAMRQIARAQVPDFPDRIVAATALYLGVPLISRDHKIRTSNVTTIW